MSASSRFVRPSRFRHVFAEVIHPPKFFSPFRAARNPFPAPPSLTPQLAPDTVPTRAGHQAGEPLPRPRALPCDGRRQLRARQRQVLLRRGARRRRPRAGHPDVHGWQGGFLAPFLSAPWLAAASRSRLTNVHFPYSRALACASRCRRRRRGLGAAAYYLPSRRALSRCRAPTPC